MACPSHAVRRAKPRPVDQRGRHAAQAFWGGMGSLVEKGAIQNSARHILAIRFIFRDAVDTVYMYRLCFFTVCAVYPISLCISPPHDIKP